MSKYARLINQIVEQFSDRASQLRELPAEIQEDFIEQADVEGLDTGLIARFISDADDVGYEARQFDEFNFGVIDRSTGEFLMDNLDPQQAERVAEQYNIEEAMNLADELPREVVGAMSYFDQSGAENLMPSIMNRITAPAAGGVVVGGGLLAPDQAQAMQAPQSQQQISSLLAVPAEVGSALNEAVVGTLDFIGPDTINAVSELSGSDFRVPRLSDQELVRRYTQGGYMQQGVPRDAIRTATGLLSPL